MDEVAALRARVEALEVETAAYSTIFSALGHVIGPQFLELAANLAELTGANPQSSGPLSKRAIEALRIIDDIRRSGQGDTKPKGVV